ncbi:type IV pilus assembly protein FimV [Methylomonas albis]|uniref:Tetratricopeptide repeat protein n=1 Tax=Methylomonas albis TaxID=1854563 RepID=A0ABR9D0F3_9GAMM|nr:hypothetical protein [Methylomonas albis]MBD9356613.1 hypothetical protein [Methylomonas albis]
MPQYFSRLIAGQHADEFSQETSFWRDQALVLLYNPDGDQSQTLNALVFKVGRQPKDLLAHVRRIYFCYDQHLAEQLYAALLDLLIVLDGKGSLISRRMIEASRSRLNSGQFQALHKTTGRAQFGNPYSLFSSGITGSRELVSSQQQTEMQHDFLELANDFIEYSQLEQAMDVLETGISLHPERADLQQALLELYKSIGNRERFQIHQQRFSDSGVALLEEWLVLAQFFDRQES